VATTLDPGKERLPSRRRREAAIHRQRVLRDQRGDIGILRRELLQRTHPYALADIEWCVDELIRRARLGIDARRRIDDLPAQIVPAGRLKHAGAGRPSRKAVHAPGGHDAPGERGVIDLGDEEKIGVEAADDHGKFSTSKDSRNYASRPTWLCAGL